jgi:hypothetical protein
MPTNSEIKKIHILKNLLSLDDDLYREILAGFGCSSSKELPAHLVHELISMLEKMAVEAGVWVIPNRRFKDLNNRDGMATPKQLRKIEAMWRDVAYQKDDEYVRTSFRKFLQKQFKISDLRFVEKSMASKIIKAINSIQKQHSPSRDIFFNSS